jgi:hypothetical protein
LAADVAGASPEAEGAGGWLAQPAASAAVAAISKVNRAKRGAPGMVSPWSYVCRIRQNANTRLAGPARKIYAFGICHIHDISDHRWN